MAIPVLAAWIGLVAIVRRAVPMRISGRQSGAALVAIYVAAMAIGGLAIPADSCRLHFRQLPVAPLTTFDICAAPTLVT
ncbi:hypothetical protein [Burkholderia plantarii]|uniref:hypothetical protein n=1 Tax=Burkholderia plantarii TaxID=41899 RepID=UPI0018DAF87D|nr:hypothetical protein [Burkholderia plantarii]